MLLIEMKCSVTPHPHLFRILRAKNPKSHPHLLLCDVCDVSTDLLTDEDEFFTVGCIDIG